jgi:hypothetical protein
MPGLVYLASPYSHDDPRVREARFRLACEAASVIMRAGLHVFSPIAHTHPIAMAGGLPTGWDYWRGYDEAMLGACGAMAILQIPGWRESRGVQGEFEIAQKLGLPVAYVDPANVEASVGGMRKLLDEAPVRRTVVGID